MSSPGLDALAWSSRWSRRAVGEKVLLSGGLVLCALVLPVWPGCSLVALTAVAALLGPARVPPRGLAVAVHGIAWFIGLGALTLMIGPDPGVAGRSDVIAAGLGLALTRTGLHAAAATTAHAVAGTAAMMLLACTTPMTDLLAWAGRRGVPAVVVEIADLTYRFIAILWGTTLAVTAAQTARLGYRTRATTLRSSSQLAAVVLTRAWERARRLEQGLAGRGYDGTLRVLREERPISRRFIALSVLVLAGVVALSLAGGAA